MAEKDYIEREAFIEILNKTKKDCKHYADKVCCDFAIKMANLMPPADVQEVRHGKWENVGDNLIMEQTTIVGKYVKCSECGNEILVARTDNGSYRFRNYCANCGAKMVKE